MLEKTINSNLEGSLIQGFVRILEECKYIKNSRD
ncbi:Uncharacterised protein [Clostridium sporogenes]|uniref:Uncharacterized protein n=1 Tax=Clostridium sporogenes TaxID=1509 RepID=A0A7U4LN98_CLOSG|nr:hypothetical protein CLSPO_c23820 [Clostridium sporogenes]KCZ67789.1 hypothetical protein CSPO_7c01320 [Clostridium sporogenes]SQC04019.1 Uncharacterised protein [Clostridium sporogenes]